MKKIISIILLAVIISTSVLFTGCGGGVGPRKAPNYITRVTLKLLMKPIQLLYQILLRQQIQTNFQLNFMTTKLMNSFQNQTKTTLTKS